MISARRPVAGFGAIAGTSAAASSTVRRHPSGCESSSRTPLPLGSTTVIAISVLPRVAHTDLLAYAVEQRHHVDRRLPRDQRALQRPGPQAAHRFDSLMIHAVARVRHVDTHRLLIRAVQQEAGLAEEDGRQLD